MPLPKIDKPLFDLKIPSTGNVVRCRPFLVKEEKILLTGQQSGDDKDIVLAIKQVLNNCIEDPAFNCDQLTTYDLEYMFLKLRARSINNIIEVSYRDGEDNQVYDFKIDLEDVEMVGDEEINNKIMVTDEVGIIMNHPSVTILDKIPAGATSTDLVEHLIINCIESVFDAESVYPASEEPEEDKLEFISNLDVATFDKIRNFFDSLPKLYHKIEYKNSLGNDRVIELSSLRDFFTWG